MNSATNWRRSLKIVFINVMSLSGPITHSIIAATEQLAQLLATIQQASVAASHGPVKWVRLINHYRGEQNARVESCSEPKTQGKIETKKWHKYRFTQKKKLQRKPEKYRQVLFLQRWQSAPGNPSIWSSANYASYSSRHVSDTGGQRTMDTRHRTPDAGQRTADNKTPDR